MESKESYRIGPGLRTKLRQMVDAFDGRSIGGGASRIPTVSQEMFRRGGGTTTSSPLRLCKTVGAWAKGTSAVVEIWEDCDCGAEGVSRDTAGNKLTLTAWNKYANIPGDRFCSVALHGNGCYYVVSAECA